MWRECFFFIVFAGFSFSSIIQELTDLTEEEPYGYLHFGEIEFGKYFEKREEKYTLVLLFTSKEHCQICPDVEEPFHKIAYSYKVDKRFDPLHNQIPVYFAEIVYNKNNMKLFNKYNIRSTPVIHISRDAPKQ